MRKIARSIARANMRRAGVRHMNKKRYLVKDGRVTTINSFFAENWRKWL